MGCTVCMRAPRHAMRCWADSEPKLPCLRRHDFLKRQLWASDLLLGLSHNVTDFQLSCGWTRREIPVVDSNHQHCPAYLISLSHPGNQHALKRYRSTVKAKLHAGRAFWMTCHRLTTASVFWNFFRAYAYWEVRWRSRALVWLGDTVPQVCDGTRCPRDTPLAGLHSHLHLRFLDLRTDTYCALIPLWYPQNTVDTVLNNQQCFSGDFM